MLRLYTYWRSSAAYRARIALHWKGLPFESVPKHFGRGEHRGGLGCEREPFTVLVGDEGDHLRSRLVVGPLTHPALGEARNDLEVLVALGQAFIDIALQAERRGFVDPVRVQRVEVALEGPAQRLLGLGGRGAETGAGGGLRMDEIKWLLSVVVDVIVQFDRDERGRFISEILYEPRRQRLGRWDQQTAAA